MVSIYLYYFSYKFPSSHHNMHLHLPYIISWRTIIKIQKPRISHLKLFKKKLFFTSCYIILYIKYVYTNLRYILNARMLKIGILCISNINLMCFHILCIVVYLIFSITCHKILNLIF